MASIKHTLFLSLLLGIASLLPAQHPFPSGPARWDQTAYRAGNPPIQTIESFNFFTWGDTSLSGNTYTRIFQTPHINGNTPPTLLDSANAFYIGAIRQDSSGRAWFIGSGPEYPDVCGNYIDSTQEKLLYHFGAQLGDSISIELPNGSGTTYQVVVAIDTILVSGQPHRRLEWSRTHSALFLLNNDIITEGIGSRNGLFWPLAVPWEEGTTLQCYSDTSRIFGPCAPVALETPIPDWTVEIYPMPLQSSSVLRVMDPEVENFAVEILDLTGRVLAQHQLSVGDHYPLGKMNLAAGMYLYRVSTAHGELQRGRFLSP